ncbi:MAG: PilZ domain-containing protein [Gemmatimonadota bacterium]|nr:PilZ domain-containing protein [Gemmatimonadota bacterium]
MSDVPFPHRREFSRVPVHLRVEVFVAGVRLPEGTMESLSLKGGFFRCATPPAEGARCDIRLHLDGTEIEVHTQGHVVRQSADGSAIQFDEIVGVDSLEHLRNLILFNAHNPAQVEQEFHDHLGLKPGD